MGGQTHNLERAIMAATQKGANVQEKTKDNINAWGKTVVICLSFVFTCGMAYQTLDTTRCNVQNNSKKIDKNQDDIHILQVNQAKDIAFKESIFQTLTRMEKKVDSQTEKTGELTKKVIQIETKVDNLERAE